MEKFFPRVFNKKIFLKIPKESFLRIYEVKKNSKYAFYQNRILNPKSELKPDFKSKLRF
jgi:hypothetical protein